MNEQIELVATRKTGAAANRFRSEQSHGTPVEFVCAVEGRFDVIEIDLAATEENAVTARFISPQEDSLKQDWTKLLKGQMGYLNPPFDPVTPFIEKCVEEAKKGARFVLLSRAQIDANWFWLLPEVTPFVYALTPRVKFVGSKDAYPSPLILSAFNVEPEPGGWFDYFDHKGTKLARWHWKADANGNAGL